MNHKITTQSSTVGKHPDRLSHPALQSGRIGHATEPPDAGSYDRAGGFSGLLRGIFLPTAASAAAGLLSVTVLSAAATRSPDPTVTLPLLSVAALLIASLAGGVTAGLLRRDRAVSASLLSGGILAGILCLMGGLGGGGSAVSWLIRLMPLPVHGLGGLMTRRRRTKPTHAAGKHPAYR